MNRRYRLRKQLEFERVRRSGQSYAHPLIVLVAHPVAHQQDGKPSDEATESLAHTRFGVAAGRSLGGAVQRNRAKRRIRAAIHPWLALVQPGWDVILIARRPLLVAPYPALEKAIEKLLHKAGLLP